MNSVPGWEKRGYDWLFLVHLDKKRFEDFTWTFVIRQQTVRVAKLRSNPNNIHLFVALQQLCHAAFFVGLLKQIGHTYAERIAQPFERIEAGHGHAVLDAAQHRAGQACARAQIRNRQIGLQTQVFDDLSNAPLKRNVGLVGRGAPAPEAG